MLVTGDLHNIKSSGYFLRAFVALCFLCYPLLPMLVRVKLKSVQSAVFPCNSRQWNNPCALYLLCCHSFIAVLDQILWQTWKGGVLFVFSPFIECTLVARTLMFLSPNMQLAGFFWGVGWVAFFFFFFGRTGNLSNICFKVCTRDCCSTSDLWKTDPGF